jgi:hypothetical protein
MSIAQGLVHDGNVVWYRRSRLLLGLHDGFRVK